MNTIEREREREKKKQSANNNHNNNEAATECGNSSRVRYNDGLN